MTKPNETTKTYSKLQGELEEVPWIVNGSAIKVAPRTAGGNTTYIWTRKVKGKTVTVALSREQYEAFSKAIEANRKLEKTIAKMRSLSEKTLLDSLPGVQAEEEVAVEIKRPPPA